MMTPLLTVLFPPGAPSHWGFSSVCYGVGHPACLPGLGGTDPSPWSPGTHGHTASGHLWFTGSGIGATVDTQSLVVPWQHPWVPSVLADEGVQLGAELASPEPIWGRGPASVPWGGTQCAPVPCTPSQRPLPLPPIVLCLPPTAPSHCHQWPVPPVAQCPSQSPQQSCALSHCHQWPVLPQCPSQCPQ